jgi:hypothetical protein
MIYYILKQFFPGSDIWVAQLNDDDNIYQYDTLEEAETALPQVQLLYPDNVCKISNTI